MAPNGVLSVKSPEAFRTISEVAAMLDVPQHVLRFWETRFSQIRPIKRAGGRRFYRPEDVDLLRGIQMLLYLEGYTIRGAQKVLREKGVRYTAALGREQAKNGHAPEEPPEEIASIPPENGHDTFELSPDLREDVSETDDAGALAPAIDSDAREADSEDGVLASPPAPDPAVRMAEPCAEISPRRARLLSLRDDLQEMKSRLAAARHNSL
jgi:DNA-binding transcriptional MerR regulator